jgi:AbrB family looped-hinge helix DNA binding protein
MQTTVSQRGQTVIPAVIRERHHIEKGHRLIWIDDGETISVIPIPADPVAALYGRGKGQGLTRKLLAERARDRAAENGE